MLVLLRCFLSNLGKQHKYYTDRIKLFSTKRNDIIYAQRKKKIYKYFAYIYI